MSYLSYITPRDGCPWHTYLTQVAARLWRTHLWSEDEINVRLDEIMVEALRKIWDSANRHKVSLRTATLAVACERILLARQERGLYP